MLSETLLNELKTIFEKEFSHEFDAVEIQDIANLLVGSFLTLYEIKIHKNEDEKVPVNTT